MSVRALPKFQNVKLAFFPLWFEFEIIQTREAQGRNHRPQSNSSWHTDQYYRSTAACLKPGNQIKRDAMNKKVKLIHPVWVTQAPYMPQWVWKFHFFLLCSSASRHRDADAFVRSLNRCASSILVPRHEGWLGRTGIV